MARAVVLIHGPTIHAVPPAPPDLPVRDITFPASDGVRLSGWLSLANRAAPAVILVAGFKDDRATMIPYAEFLHKSGYTVLLYDSRGTGLSGGGFSLGLSEVNDVLGAVRYLESHAGAHSGRIGVLGVSLGAGVAIVAAARDREIGAVVADSAYVDQRATVERLDTFQRGSIRVPLPPLAPLAVDVLLGADYTSFSPLRSIQRLPPRPVLLIHCLHDDNPTTPLSGALQLLHAGAHSSTTLWVAPYGAHAAALSGQFDAYRGWVLGFFAHSIGTP